MKNRRGDIIATVSLLPTDAGGRRGPTPDGEFNCLLTIDEKNFDVRLNLEGTGSISPGQTVSVPISFLDRECAKKYCSLGKKFSIREVDPIGHGVIDEIAFLDDGVVTR